MKKAILFMSVGIAVFLAQSASAQSTLVNSWENATEGWGTDGTIWTSGGFSTTSGVTQGSDSWILNASAGPGYAFSIGSTASTALTALLANSASIKIDVLAGGSFGYQQWDLTLNNSVFGYQSMDSYGFSQSPSLNSESTLTFTIPSTYLAQLAANPASTTSINFQIGGGSAGTMYLDNLRIIAAPEPTTLALAGLGVIGLVAARRRKA